MERIEEQSGHNEKKTKIKNNLVGFTTFYKKIGISAERTDFLVQNTILAPLHPTSTRKEILSSNNIELKYGIVAWGRRNTVQETGKPWHWLRVQWRFLHWRERFQQPRIVLSLSCRKPKEVRLQHIVGRGCKPFRRNKRVNIECSSACTWRTVTANQPFPVLAVTWTIRQCKERTQKYSICNDLLCIPGSLSRLTTTQCLPELYVQHVGLEVGVLVCLRRKLHYSRGFLGHSRTVEAQGRNLPPTSDDTCRASSVTMQRLRPLRRIPDKQWGRRLQRRESMLARNSMTSTSTARNAAASIVDAGSSTVSTQGRRFGRRETQQMQARGLTMLAMFSFSDCYIEKVNNWQPWKRSFIICKEAWEYLYPRGEVQGWFQQSYSREQKVSRRK